MIINPKVIKKVESSTELPAFMSAKNFTFDGNACTGYVGDNTLPEIIIPQSYSTVASTETVVGAKVLDKENLSMSIYDFQSATFSDGGTNTQTYTSTSQLQNLSTDFPNDCYLVSMQGSNPFSFDFLQMASDMQMLQFPIAVNGQSFSDGMAAFEYILSNDITNVNFGGDVEVTKFVDGNDYQVTSVIGLSNGSGFKNYQNRIILLSNLTSIGGQAFDGCSALTSIEIPSSVTSIGNAAFQNCSSLTSITIPDSVTNIESNVFRDCSSLNTITIPDSVTSIGSYAFYACTNLISVSISENVTEIGQSTFYNCTNLTKITLPSSVTSIAAYAFAGCTNLTAITIPENVTSIGSYAFRDCSSLASIEIPDSVMSVGEYAFTNCDNLQYYTDNEVKYLGNVTNNYVLLVSADNFIGNSYQIQVGCKVICVAAFRSNSSLTTIIIPDSVVSIENVAFSNCENLDTITFEDNSQLTNINSSVFSGCTNLVAITIPDSVTSIGSSAFSGCSGLTSITLPSRLTSIDIFAFEDCSNLTSITIPNSVTSIGQSAFDGCSSLRSITIPENVTRIRYNAFKNCRNLITMRVEALTPPTLSSTSAISSATTQIQVPMASVDAYKTATNWTNFADIIVGYTE